MPPAFPQMPGAVPDSGNSFSMALAPLAQLPVAIPKPPSSASSTAGHAALVLAGALSPSGALALSPFSPQPPMPTLTPLRNIPGGGRLPQLPKGSPVSVPKAMHAKVPTVKLDSGNALLPPPPPPMHLVTGGFGEHAMSIVAIPPEEGEPMVARSLVPHQAGPRRGGPTAKLPRPPPKMHTAPTARPPSGPPPAHAIVLARKAGVAGFDQEELVKQARPPPHVPKPPMEKAPANTRREVPAVNPKVVDGIAMARKNKDIVQGVADPFAAARQDPVGHVVMQRRAHDEKAPPPVPDWQRDAGLGVVWFIMVVHLLAFIAVITVWGTYLPTSAVYPTYAATVLGIAVNFGLFESVKCVVIACLAMVHDETEKRDIELRARRARLELKAQRFVQRGKHRGEIVH